MLINSPNQKKDNGLEHIVQYIMFTTVLSQRFADVLGDMIESAESSGADTAVVIRCDGQMPLWWNAFSLLDIESHSNFQMTQYTSCLSHST